MRTSYRVYQDCDYYFVTCTITDWCEIFWSDKYCTIIISSLQYCRKVKGLYLYYYVIMPDHIHMIISSESYNISAILRDFKRYTSKKISSLLKEDRSFEILSRFSKAANRTIDNNRYRVWQEGFHPKAIVSEPMLNQKIEYIHLNPVKKRFVKEPEDWKYSSARNIYLKDNSIIELDEIGM
jgi:putative transposase